MRICFILLVSIFLVQCASNKKFSKRFDAPPGTVKVGIGIYFDKFELTNSGYNEYLYDLRRIYGENSIEYTNAIVDLESCKYQSFVNSLEYYYGNILFDSHPTVGITYEQARLFTEWRSDKVAEMLLIEKKYVRINQDQTRTDKFTIKAYLAGTYSHILIHDPTILFPEYRIPTAEEWVKFSGVKSKGSEVVIADNSHNRRLEKKYGLAYNTLDRYNYNKDRQSDYNHFIDPSFNFSSNYIANGQGDKNDIGLFNIIGNVSEIVDTGKVIGGNWLQSLNVESLTTARKVNMPNCFTGFRNICYYKPQR